MTVVDLELYVYVAATTSYKSVGEIKGPKGDRGIQGIQGPAGPQGHTGVEGARGQDGIQGVDGVDGPTGYTGYTGFTGYTGPTGAFGGIVYEPIIPYANEVINIGSATERIQTLYVRDVNASGSMDLPVNTTIGGLPVGTSFNFRDKNNRSKSHIF